MEDLIAETPAQDIEGLGIKLALYVYMSGVDPEFGQPVSTLHLKRGSYET